jgi:hypothetical protein
MAIRKYGDAGDGKILPDEDTKKTASSEQWTPDDEAELHRELADDADGNA